MVMQLLMGAMAWEDGGITPLKSMLMLDLPILVMGILAGCIYLIVSGLESKKEKE